MTESDTKTMLRAAATLEFGEVGFEGTNSNRIARRAGFAPQTFYRHYADKLAVFLDVYRHWWRDELDRLAPETEPHEAATLIVAAHRESRIFRRSLRAVTHTEPEVATARAEARLAQMERLAERGPHRPPLALAAKILILERVADAIVEGEFTALGFEERDAIDELARHIAS